MRLKCVLAVAGLAFALSQSVAVQGQGSSPMSEAEAVKAFLQLTTCEPVFLAKFQYANGAFSPDSDNPGDYISQFNLPTVDPESGGKSGEWSLKDPYYMDGYDVVAWVVKGGPNGFDVQTGDPKDAPFTIGKWIMDENVLGNHEISHLSFYGCSKSVPEPTSILAGIAALGMFALGRKRLA